MKVEGKPSTRRLIAVLNDGVLSFRDSDRYGNTKRINSRGEATAYGSGISLEDHAAKDGSVSYYEGDTITITF